MRFFRLSLVSLCGHAVLGLLLVGLGVGRSCTSLKQSVSELEPGQGRSRLLPDELDLACLLDEAYSTSVLVTACAIPGVSFDSCAAEAVASLELSLLGCQVTRAIDIAMIEPEVLSPMAMPLDEDKQKELELEKKLEEEKKEEERDTQVPSQVVDIDRPDVEMVPDDPKYSAEYDSKVEKQTKAPPGREVSRKRVASVQPEQDAQDERPARPEKTKVALRTGGRGVRAPGDPLGLHKQDPDGSGRQQGEQGDAGDEQGAKSPTAKQDASKGQKALPKMAQLRPSKDVINKATGGSSDYLKDVDEGEETLLNSKRWKHAGFFNRVKRAVQQYYNPEVAYRLRDPSGQIYGHKNRLTILKVSLERDGSLHDILIEKPCGIDFLDDEAVKAFKEAQPFPNPPLGLVDATSNLITFRFGFYFEITETGSWKVFRYSN